MKALKPHPQLEILARRYIWWENVLWAFEHPMIFLTNIMELGTWEDIQTARKILGDHLFKEVLKNAPPGYFHYRAWDYWHHKFNMLPIPPLPEREFK